MAEQTIAQRAAAIAEARKAGQPSGNKPPAHIPLTAAQQSAQNTAKQQASTAMSKGSDPGVNPKAPVAHVAHGTVPTKVVLEGTATVDTLEVKEPTPDAANIEESPTTAAARATARASTAADAHRIAPTPDTEKELAEANAALDATGKKTLKERLAEAVAATSNPAAAGLTTGMVSSQANFVDGSKLAAAAASAPIVPVKTDSKQVLFKTERNSLGSATPNSKHFTFKQGYLLTSDPDIIAFVRENAARWLVTEVGGAPVQQQQIKK